MRDPLATTRKVKILRLIFWACLAATMAVPSLGILYAMAGHELTAAAGVICYVAFVGLCFSCGLLVDHQPKLAGRGMLCLVLFFILLFFSGALLGPIQN